MANSLQALTESALQYLDRAEDRGLITGPSRNLVGGRVRQLAEQIDAYAQQTAIIRGDARLSETGQNERLEGLFNQAEERIVGTVNDIGERIEDAIEQARRRATPTPTSVSDEQLHAARTDARMVLDAIDPSHLPDKMAHLAEHANEAIRHLLLGTDWPSLYFMTRGGDAAMTRWNQRRSSLLSLVLDEGGQAAERALGAEHDLRAVFKLANAAAQMWRSQNQPRGAQPTAGAMTTEYGAA